MSVLTSVGHVMIDTNETQNFNKFIHVIVNDRKKELKILETWVQIMATLIFKTIEPFGQINVD